MTSGLADTPLLAVWRTAGLMDKTKADMLVLHAYNSEFLSLLVYFFTVFLGTVIPLCCSFKKLAKKQNLQEVK